MNDAAIAALSAAGGGALGAVVNAVSAHRSAGRDAVQETLRLDRADYRDELVRLRAVEEQHHTLIAEHLVLKQNFRLLLMVLTPEQLGRYHELQRQVHDGMDLE